MYLVDDVLKYFKVFLLGMLSEASLIHLHGWHHPLEDGGYGELGWSYTVPRGGIWH
jgi:hypothetical protein